LSQLQENQPDEADPCSLLFEIFSKLFLFPSAEQGLIDLKQLALSGDGTPVYTDPVYAFMDKKRAQGKPYYVYMTAGSNKFLRIYYGRVKEYLSTLSVSG